MTTEKSLVRTVEDLIETVKAIARLFRSDEVFIIGSQSILLSWPDAPVMMRTSGEIDAYPGNARLWEVARKELDPEDAPEASEEIAVLFGEGSAFHRKHGFYIDGVDENTARVPQGWKNRAIVRAVEIDGRIVRAVAPCPEDVVVSKLARLNEKDRDFIMAYHTARPLDPRLIEDRIKVTDLDPAVSRRAVDYIRSLASAAG
jgi:Nucleotidyltransferase of unknown function (DUF6036)